VSVDWTRSEARTAEARKPLAGCAFARQGHLRAFCRGLPAWTAGAAMAVLAVRIKILVHLGRFSHYAIIK